MNNFILLLKSFRLLNVFSMLLLLVGLRVYRYNLSVEHGIYFFSRSLLEFIILLIIVGVISAAGYLINDIIDVDVDKMNKPYKKLGYSIKTSWGIYIAMNLIAICLSILIAESVSTFLILMLSIIFLYWYSVIFQKLPLIGNLIVAGLACAIPFLYSEFDMIIETNHLFLRVSYLFSIIAFVLTLFREIVKDIEDLKGDKLYNYNTLPIKLGEKKTGVILRVLMFSVLLLPSFFFWLVLPFSIDYLSFLFSVVFGLISSELIIFIVLLIYILSMYFVFRNNYTKASLFLKLTLFSGVLILFIL